MKFKTSLITGASDGIGKGVAEMLASKSDELILLGQSLDKLEKLKLSLEKINKNISIYAFNVLTEDMPLELLDSLKLESKPIDVCIHAIGGFDKMSSESIWEDYEKVMFLNLGFSHTINQLIIPGMVKNNFGKIVHISSLVTKVNNGNAPYVMSKSAIESYVESFSLFVAGKSSNININCVSPGPINVKGKGLNRLFLEDKTGLAEWLKSHRIISKRLGSVDEVVSVIDFLCSSGSNFMYGSNLRIDGGGI